MTCRCCGTALRIYTQTALMAGRADYELAECRNPFCDLRDITLRRGEHEKLTDAEIQSYVRARQATEARGVRV